MFTRIALAAATLSSIALAADPPKPNPDKPVNYVAWLAKEYSTPSGENAAAKYLRAAELFQSADDETAATANTDLLKWGKYDREKLEAWVKKNEEALRIFSEAARTENCMFPIPTGTDKITDIMLPEMAKVRNLCRVLATKARLQLLAGDVAGIQKAAETLLRCGDHMQDQPFLIQYLVGIAIDALGYSLLLEIPRIDPAGVDYEKLLSEIDAVDRAPERAEKQLAVERISAWDFIQRDLRDSNHDGKLDSVKSFQNDDWTPLPVGVTQTQLLEQIDSVFDELRGLFRGRYRDSQERAKRIEGMLNAPEAKAVGLFVPSLDRAAVLYRRICTDRNRFRVVYRLYAYRAEHGNWPERLDQVLSRREQRTWTDAFADGPFGYRLESGEPLLYSVGEDGDDDGGKPGSATKPDSWNMEGDVILWPWSGV